MIFHLYLLPSSTAQKWEPFTWVGGERRRSSGVRAEAELRVGLEKTRINPADWSSWAPQELNPSVIHRRRHWLRSNALTAVPTANEPDLACGRIRPMHPTDASNHPLSGSQMSSAPFGFASVRWLRPSAELEEKAFREPACSQIVPRRLLGTIWERQRSGNAWTVRSIKKKKTHALISSR